MIEASLANLGVSRKLGSTSRKLGSKRRKLGSERRELGPNTRRLAAKDRDLCQARPYVPPALNTLITAQGHKALIDELETLWQVERPKVTHEVHVAAAHGDRSENAEYKYGKQRLREIDRRLRFLKRRIQSVTVSEPNPQKTDRVHFGCWVQVYDERKSQSLVYRIVGTDEVNPDLGQISVLSPIGRALLGKELDDEIEVKTPKGSVLLLIEDIQARAIAE